MARPRVALGPSPAPAWLEQTARDAGAEIVAPGDAEAVLWATNLSTGELFEILAGAPGIRWVHLRGTGVEDLVARMDDGRVWTCPKGAIGDIVAEHALALGLVGLRGLRQRLRATEWGEMSGRSLVDGNVTIVGGGGIARSLARLLAPWRVAVTIVRRTDAPFPGSARTLTSDRLDEALPGADLVVIATPLTPATTGMIGARQLRLMEPHAWLVNVARGAQVVTDELVTALREGWIGGAALDVTDPEPLPPEHPLWSLERCVITPHTASTTDMSLPGLKSLIVENISRFAAGQPLLGVIDPVAGY